MDKNGSSSSSCRSVVADGERERQRIHFAEIYRDTSIKEGFRLMEQGIRLLLHMEEMEERREGKEDTDAVVESGQRRADQETVLTLFYEGTSMLLSAAKKEENIQQQQALQNSAALCVAHAERLAEQRRAEMDLDGLEFEFVQHRITMEDFLRELSNNAKFCLRKAMLVAANHGGSNSSNDNGNDNDNGNGGGRGGNSRSPSHSPVRARTSLHGTSPSASPTSVRHLYTSLQNPYQIIQQFGKVMNVATAEESLDRARARKRAYLWCMEAAEKWIKWDRHKPDQNIRNYASQCLSQCEKIAKEFEQHNQGDANSSERDTQQSTAVGGHGTTPRPRRQLSDAQIQILKKTSTINGKTVLPFIDEMDEWTIEEPKIESPEGEIFTDGDATMELTAAQRKEFANWARPSQNLVKSGQSNLIRVISALTVRQKLVQDCSFISSLCVAANFERRFGRPLISHLIYPRDKNNVPMLNPRGKYIVKLFFNGMPRKVVIDDRLPVDKNGEYLCSCSTNPNEHWVSLLEKAYLKLHGNTYQFVGSNSGIDVNTLTGWIPEDVDLAVLDVWRSEGIFEKELADVWQKILNGHQSGKCLITASSRSDMTTEEQHRIGLYASHSYAVLDVREIVLQSGDRLQMLQLKNPWTEKRWKGRFSPADDESWTEELLSELSYDLIGAMLEDNGVFWLDLESLCLYFQTIHLSWASDERQSHGESKFHHRKVHHDEYSPHFRFNNGLKDFTDRGHRLQVDKDGFVTNPSEHPMTGYNMAKYPQFCISTRLSDFDQIWIVFHRHITTSNQFPSGGQLDQQSSRHQQQEQQEQKPQNLNFSSGFVNMHVYLGGRVVYHPLQDGLICQGEFGNSTLLRLVVSRDAILEVISRTGGDQHDDQLQLTLVISQLEPAVMQYTLEIFSTSDAPLNAIDPLLNSLGSTGHLYVLKKPPELDTSGDHSPEVNTPLPYQHELRSAWTIHNSGGGVNYPQSFHTNPQFRFQLFEKDVRREDHTYCVLLTVETDKYDLSVNIIALRQDEPNGRVRYATSKNLLGVSGPYKRSYSVCQIEIPQDIASFVIIPSNYYPGGKGDFVLSVHCEREFLLSALDLV